jgi:alpha-glucosidase
MKQRLLFPVCIVLSSILHAQRTSGQTIHSPDGKIVLRVSLGNKLSYSVAYENKVLLDSSDIDMILQNGIKLSDRLRGAEIRTHRERSVIISPVPEKRKNIPDHYNELRVQLKNHFSVYFRVFNDGLAYRIGTRFRDSIRMKQERARFRFPKESIVYFTESVKRADQDIYHTSFEEPYQVRRIDSISAANICFSPLLVSAPGAPRIVLTESDLEDYPGMFIKGSGEEFLEGDFAAYPLTEKITGEEFKQKTVTQRADFIALSPGTRFFPWRVLAIAPTDKDLPANDIVYRLASPSRVKDLSWIKPGKGTDEWIIGTNLFNVNFKTGVNTATYKYYIDFAKQFGFNRIMMDAGWSDYNDLFRINPEIDMEEISSYAKQKGIKLSMWTLALTLDKQLEPALEQFSKWGVDFIMTDFMDRDDQKMVNFYYRVAEACARHKIMIMYHGAFKPAGFNRTFPHAVTREGVLGSEYNIWSEKADPAHNLLLPFIRMVAGPMDYEPGILDNATRKTFRPISEKVMSLGTRVQQLAMFVVYESPIQIFSGNPSQAMLEERFTRLLTSIPTTWDTTVIADARLGEYIITSRKKEQDWFIGAMNNWTKKELSLPLNFLGEGEYEAEICEDGINADRNASDYKMKNFTVTKADTLIIPLAPGGGYVARLRKK